MARNRETVDFCGAFNGKVTLRDGETPQQALERAEAAMQRALDESCKRLNVTIGVDYGESV